MVIGIIIGIIILAIAIFIALKVAKDIIIGIVLIGLVLLASFFILGSIPNLKGIPIIGPILPRVPTSLTEVLSIIKRIFYEIKILDVSRDSESRGLITIKNNGRLKLSNFSVFIDSKATNIINKPKDPLNSGDITTLQTDWKKDFTEILVKSSGASAIYKK